MLLVESIGVAGAVNLHQARDQASRRPHLEGRPWILALGFLLFMFTYGDDIFSHSKARNSFVIL